MTMKESVGDACTLLRLAHGIGCLPFAVLLPIISFCPAPAVGAEEVRVSYAVLFRGDGSEVSGEASCGAHKYCFVKINRELALNVLYDQDAIRIAVSYPSDMVLPNGDDRITLEKDGGKPFNGGMFYKFSLHTGTPVRRYIYKNDLLHYPRGGEYAVIELIVK